MAVVLGAPQHLNSRAGSQISSDLDDSPVQNLSWNLKLTRPLSYSTISILRQLLVENGCA